MSMHGSYRAMGQGRVHKDKYVRNINSTESSNNTEICILQSKRTLQREDVLKVATKRPFRSDFRKHLSVQIEESFGQ